MLAGWDPEAERRSKEVLYRCMEELGATKAALYLAGNDGTFELAASYGFGRRDALAADVKPGNPLWDWIRRHRTTPAYLNDAHDDPSLGPILAAAGTARLLTIPLSVGDRLVGMVEALDKARKANYGPDDLGAARTIGKALEAFVREIGAYGPPEAAAKASAVPAPAPPATTARAANLYVGTIESLASLIRVLSPLAGVAGTALTVSDGKTVRASVLRTVPLEHQQREALASHQLRCFEESGPRLPPPSRWGWSEGDSGGSEKKAEEIRTSLLHAGPPLWVALSVLTPAGDPVAQTVLAVVRAHLELARSLRTYRKAARNLARTLLEPGETSYPHLRQHSQAVSEMAQRMAAAMQLGEDDEEAITVAGYLHDIGMRELDYARIYRMDRPGDMEKRMYQRHPIVGARILDGTDFPGDVAALVRHHHERWDGNGYPQHVAGRNIPLGSRIIHLAEVYDTLTSPSSYRRSVGREGALDVIRGEAGKQFDPELIPVLEELARS